MSESDTSSSHNSNVLRFVSRVRVRYAETDAMGWVYYACYFHYFEVARSELIREVWKSYRRIEDEEGMRLPVIETGCSYISGAKYEDELEIDTELRTCGARVRFDYLVRQSSNNALVARGYTEHCFADHNGRPKRMPPAFLRLFLT